MKKKDIQHMLWMYVQEIKINGTSYSVIPKTIYDALLKDFIPPVQKVSDISSTENKKD